MTRTVFVRRRRASVLMILALISAMTSFSPGPTRAESIGRMDCSRAVGGGWGVVLSPLNAGDEFYTKLWYKYDNAWLGEGTWVEHPTWYWGDIFYTGTAWTRPQPGENHLHGVQGDSGTITVYERRIYLTGAETWEYVGSCDLVVYGYNWFPNFTWPTL